MANNFEFEKRIGMIFAVIVLLISAIVLIWFPTQKVWLDIPLVTWLMIISWFIWGLLSVIFVLIMEKNNQ